ncbi:hypothetical protein ACH3PA_18325 [Leeuwenhoekiella sp. A2]|uniref:hypothetical protein n=1 Tax=Leeuwenhoekiella sp. A2 TaxID=3141460 RepID=UPI003A7FE5A9
MNITTVEFYISNESIVNTWLDLNTTILDSDIVIFDPDQFKNLWKDHVRKQDNNSEIVFSPHSDQINLIFERKRKEVETLLNKGKIIINILSPIHEVYGQLGNSSNFEKITNYDHLPNGREYPFEDLVAGVSQRKNALTIGKTKNIFSQFFYAFKNEIAYTAYFDIDGDNQTEFFILNKAQRPIASIQQYSNGIIVNLPKLINKFDENKFLGVIRQCSQKYFKNHSQTPPPEWTNEYELNGEKEIEKELINLEEKIEGLKQEKQKVENNKNELTKYKQLLFEQGPELEEVVLNAFKLFGFDAFNRKSKDLEHDIVFEAKEGRGVAEIEGKDKDSIHIGKLDQLNRAVDEDFDLTDIYPQGILIGNHFRLQNPEDRGEPFTEKVHIVAKKKSFGLLNTIEIYKAVNHLIKNPNDENFKTKCREAILNTVGKEIILTQ